MSRIVSKVKCLSGLSTLSKVEGYFEKVGGECRAKQGEQI
jgi:hypothetical protein